jgi:hypothetical protein
MVTLPRSGSDGRLVASEPSRWRTVNDKNDVGKDGQSGWAAFFRKMLEFLPIFFYAGTSWIKIVGICPAEDRRGGHWWAKLSGR